MTTLLGIPTYLIALPAIERPASMIVKRYALVEVIDHQPGNRYYVGYQINDNNGQPHGQLYLDPVVYTSRFALAEFADPIVIFVSTSKDGLQLVPIRLVDRVPYSTIFDDQVTLIG